MVVQISKEEQKRMSYEAIEKKYGGKWLYLVNATQNPLSAIPVIVADKWWEDEEKGVYEKYENDASYRPTMHLSFLPDTNEMLGQY
jgi:hypothetical protein